MSDQQFNRAELLPLFFKEISRLSTWTVIFHTTAATRLGLNPTDLKCGGVLSETGPITAGELAELTGLTTGAITGVVDRLEQAGFVRRVRSEQDRRQVIVEPLDAMASTAVQALFEPLAAATMQLLERYSDAELAFLVDYVQRSANMLKQQVNPL